MSRESSAKPRNHDREHADHPALDVLRPWDVAAYRSGAWLGTKVTSAELRGASKRDLEAVAELAARIQVMREASV